MNSLKQIEPGIFGSQKELNALAEKNEAKLIVISDSHGNTPLLSYVIKEYAKECDALVFAGDGASDLVSIIEAASSDRNIKEMLPPIIIFVKGNNDPFQCFAKIKSLKKIFSPKDSAFTRITVPREVVFTAAGKKILVLHGHEQGVYYSNQALTEYAHKKDCSITIHGHTHVPCENYFSVYTINPGSLSLPRMSSKQGFAYLFVRPDVTYTTFFGLSDRKTLTFSSYSPDTYF